jgi:hypothetical protein
VSGEVEMVKPGLRTSAAVVALIAAVAGCAYAIPLIGLPLSLILPLLTHRLRRYLWSPVPSRSSLIWSLVAWAGLWWPALLGLFTPLLSWAGIEISTSWLIIPLCGPDNLAAVIVPALAAAVVCALGAAGASVIRHPWPWVLTAWLAPWAHQLTLALLPHEMIC